MRKLYCVNYRHLLNGQWGRAFALSIDSIETLRAELAGHSASSPVSVHPGYTEVGLDLLSLDELEWGLMLVGAEIHAWERISVSFEADDLLRNPVKAIKDLQELGREMFELHDEKMRKERCACQVDGIGNGTFGNGAGGKDLTGVG